MSESVSPVHLVKVSWVTIKLTQAEQIQLWRQFLKASDGSSIEIDNQVLQEEETPLV